MLRVFVRVPSVMLWPFLLGLASGVFRGGLIVPWLAHTLWSLRVQARLWWWCVLAGACWSMCVLPASWTRMSWSAWVSGNPTERVTITSEESREIVRWRHWGGARIRQVIAEREATLATALLYGEGRFSARDQQLVRSIGLSHITAVSGANLSFLLLIFLTASGWKRFPYRTRIWIQQGLILFCVVFTGASSSMVRAGIMATIRAWAMSFGRRSSFLRSLLAAMGLIVLFEPRRLFVDLGWQFSFLACLGLSIASQDEERRSTLVEGLRLSFWAWLWTLPLQLWRFQAWSWIGIIATVVLLPTIELLQIGTVVTILLPFSWVGAGLQGMLSMVWGSIECVAAWQQPIMGATGGVLYLSLYIPLALVLIHKNIRLWGGDVSSFSDTSWKKRMLTLGKWGWHLPNILDTCPDLLIMSFVSMLKTSANNTD